jgi:hypothetical protein
MCMGTSKCGSDMQYTSSSHEGPMVIEWLDVMVSSVLSGKAPMQLALAFDPYLFLVSGGH